METCFSFIRTILELAIPTLTAWLLCDMADALLRLDTQAIYSRMIPFGIAVFLEAVVYQLVNMSSDLLIVRRAGAYQNFLMGRLLHRPLTQQAEAVALLQELVFEKDLEDRLDTHGSNLSPGERQKLLSARAILRNCPFLVMDEPLNHMDARETETLLSILHSRKGLVVISHQNAGMNFLAHRRA